MTPAEICSLSQATLEKVQVLKQQFDLIFENLLLSGSKADLDIAEGLRSQIERELQHLPIAWSLERVSDTTRIYIGKLEPGIFDQLPDSLESIYTSFPEGEIYFEDLEIGGKNAQELKELMAARELDGNVTAMTLLESYDFATLKTPKTLKLACFAVTDLGFRDETDVNEIFDRAQELGLELCPAEVCIYYLLQRQDQLKHPYIHVGMKPKDQSRNTKNIYSLAQPLFNQLSLTYTALWPGKKMSSDARFLFCFPKKT